MLFFTTCTVGFKPQLPTFLLWTSFDGFCPQVTNFCLFMCVFMYHILVHKNTLLWLGWSFSFCSKSSDFYLLGKSELSAFSLHLQRDLASPPSLMGAGGSPSGVIATHYNPAYIALGFSKSEIPQTSWCILKCHLVGNFMFSWRSRVEIVISQIWPLTLNPLLPMTFLTHISPWKKIYTPCTSARPLKWTVHAAYSALAGFWA